MVGHTYLQDLTVAPHPKSPLPRNSIIVSEPLKQSYNPCLLGFSSFLTILLLEMGSLVDIVTLENLEQKLFRWDSSKSNHLYALVDMGR